MLYFSPKAAIPKSFDPKSFGNNFQPLAYLIVVIYKSSHYCYSFSRTIVNCRKSMFLKQKAKTPLEKWYFRFITWESTTTDIVHSTFFQCYGTMWMVTRGIDCNSDKD